MSASISNITLTATVIPVGGIVSLDVQTPDSTGTWLLTRQAAGGEAVVLYDGPAAPLNPNWLDVGDLTGQPLNPALEYTYTFTSASGSATATATPAATVQVEPDPYVLIMLRVLQAGFASLALPAGWKKRPQVIHAMPIAGQPPLPLLTIQLDLVQQRDVPIGHGINNDMTDQNTYAIEETVHRRFRVTVLTSSVDEREFYRDCVIAFFKAVLVPILEARGNNIRHDFQSVSSQVVGEQMNPGFYFAELGLAFDGVLSVNLTTNYGVIEAVATNIEATEGFGL